MSLSNKLQFDKQRNTSNAVMNTINHTQPKMDSELVRFSVRAQEYMVKKGLHNYNRSIDTFTEAPEKNPNLGPYEAVDAQLDNYLNDTDL